MFGDQNRPPSRLTRWMARNKTRAVLAWTVSVGAFALLRLWTHGHLDHGLMLLLVFLGGLNVIFASARRMNDWTRRQQEPDHDPAS